MFNTRLVLTLAFAVLGLSEAGSHGSTHHVKHTNKHHKKQPTQDPQPIDATRDNGKIFAMPVDQAERQNVEQVPVRDWAADIASGHGVSIGPVDVSALKGPASNLGETRMATNAMNGQNFAGLPDAGMSGGNKISEYTLHPSLVRFTSSALKLSTTLNLHAMRQVCGAFRVTAEFEQLK